MISRNGLRRRILICVLSAVALYTGHQRLWNVSVTQDAYLRPPSQSNSTVANIRDIAQESCTELAQVVFVKVPKTGSETVSSILIQFGLTRNLTFALPKHEFYFSVYPLNIKRIMPIAEGKNYDLLVHHSTYNRDTIKAVFPTGTKIIGSVREPLSHFISAFYFFHNKIHMLNLPEEIEATANATLQMEWLIAEEYKRVSAPSSVATLEFNRQGVRLGLRLDNLLNASYVQTYINSVLDKDFDFVLVQEYFDESLVLLKRYFCWNLADIVYLTLNANPVPRVDRLYTEDIRKKHRKTAVGEYLIYEHFRRKFWLAVWREGPTFFEEVKIFKEILNRFQCFCARDPADQDVLILPPSDWNRQFSLTGERCRLMRIGSRRYAYILKDKQKTERLTEQKTAEN